MRSLRRLRLPLRFQFSDDLLEFRFRTQSLEVRIFVDGVGVFQAALDGLVEIFEGAFLVAAGCAGFRQQEYWPRFIRTDAAHELEVVFRLAETLVFQFRLPCFDSLGPEIVERAKQDQTCFIVLGMVCLVLESGHSVDDVGAECRLSVKIRVGDLRQL